MVVCDRDFWQFIKIILCVYILIDGSEIFNNIAPGTSFVSRHQHVLTEKMRQSTKLSLAHDKSCSGQKEIHGFTGNAPNFNRKRSKKRKEQRKRQKNSKKAAEEGTAHIDEIWNTNQKLIDLE